MNNTPKQSTHVDRVEDLLQCVELADIRCYELHGKRTSQDEANAEPISEAMQRIETDDSGAITLIESRIRLTATVQGGELLADYSAVYELGQPVSTTQEILTEFLSRVGVYAAYPFVRQGVLSLAENLGLERPILALVRQGDFKFTPKTQDEQ